MLNHRANVFVPGSIEQTILKLLPYMLILSYPYSISGIPKQYAYHMVFESLYRIPFDYWNIVEECFREYVSRDTLLNPLERSETVGKCRTYLTVSVKKREQKAMGVQHSCGTFLSRFDPKNVDLNESFK